MRTTSAQYDKFLKALKESRQEHVCNVLNGNFGNIEILTSASADEVESCGERVPRTSVKQAESREKGLGPSQKMAAIVGTADPELPSNKSPGKL